MCKISTFIATCVSYVVTAATPPLKCPLGDGGWSGGTEGRGHAVTRAPRFLIFFSHCCDLEGNYLSSSPVDIGGECALWALVHRLPEAFVSPTTDRHERFTLFLKEMLLGTSLCSRQWLIAVNVVYRDGLDEWGLYRLATTVDEKL